MPHDRLLTVPDVMQQCQIARSTAYALVHHLGPIHIGGAVRVSASALDAFLAAGGGRTIPKGANGDGAARTARKRQRVAS